MLDVDVLMLISTVGSYTTGASKHCSRSCALRYGSEQIAQDASTLARRELGASFTVITLGLR